MEIAELLMWLGQVLMVAAGVIVMFNLLVLVISRRIEARLEEELGEIAQDLEAEKLIALTVEVDGDQFLCYNAQTMSFVCQGRDLEEIRERFRQRYPSKSAAIYNGDESAVKVLKQQLKELNENSRSIGRAS
jgi:HAMP domain-containing protein